MNSVNDGHGHHVINTGFRCSICNSLDDIFNDCIITDMTRICAKCIEMNSKPGMKEELVEDIIAKTRKYIPSLQRQEIISLFRLYTGLPTDRIITCGYCGKILKHKIDAAIRTKTYQV
jgi:hypothetical protein